MKTFYTDRSRIETHQRCARSRYLGYHQGGTGISPARTPLPLAVGGAVHEGLAVLLRDGQIIVSRNPDYSVEEISAISSWREMEDAAVSVALADLSSHRTGGIALDTTEQAAQSTATPSPADDFSAQLAAQAAELGMDVNDPLLAGLARDTQSGAKEFDEYLWKEQSALVEGLVRAYARRRLRPLLEQFEVLEVEREGEWSLSRWSSDDRWDADGTTLLKEGEDHELYFMSRPDALLRDRTDNSLYIMSFKTASTWDVRKERDAQRDMQGLSEGIEVERRLAEWWHYLHSESDGPVDPKMNKAMYDFLSSIPAPPRILGIRYEYMLKSYRSEDRELSAKVGFRAYTQRSHLTRVYTCVSTPQRTKSTTPGFSIGDHAWSYEYLKDDGTESKLYYGNWNARPVWEEFSSVKAWIDMLDDTQMAMSQYDSTVGMEPREVGWKGAAQGIGYTKEHPLDQIFIPPMTVFRSEDDLRDLVEQMESQERRVVKALAEVEAAADEDERRSALNRNFIQSRRSCEYPSTCGFVKICWGGEDIRRDPVSSGLYVARVPNHPQEGAELVKISTDK